MSKHGPGRISCPCGNTRYTIMKTNWLECQTCGASTEITPTLRRRGMNDIEKGWDTWSWNSIKAIREAERKP